MAPAARQQHGAQLLSHRGSDRSGRPQAEPAHPQRGKRRYGDREQIRRARAANVFEAVAQDKRDDGIVQRNRLA